METNPAVAIGAANLIPLPGQDRGTLGRTGLVAPGANPADRQIPTAEVSPSASRRRPKRILIADDDFLVRGSLAAVLEYEGYVVDEACDGIEAVGRTIDHSPDIVLLDLNMPRWEGWTAFSQLDRVNPLLPVIVITARPNQYEKAARLGVDAFMEKPLNIRVLVDAIESLISRDKRQMIRRNMAARPQTLLLKDDGS